VVWDAITNSVFFFGVWCLIDYGHHSTHQLKPLPIMGLGYRWSLDFAKSLSLMPRHNRYVLVMIKHFSKWLELVPLLECNSEGTTYAFLDRMFNKFGSSTEVLID